MTEVVLFGGGCFWCIEPPFAALRGVTSVYPGYSGGTTHSPTYEQVCNQNTGHIEVIEVRYKSEQVSFKKLLEVFFSLHDPTTLNRQGNDVGSQYASAIFYSTAAQLEEATAYIASLEKKLQKPVVTRLIPVELFWPAEPEHVDYYKYNSFSPYSMAVIRPKLQQFLKVYSPLMKSDDDT